MHRHPKKKKFASLAKLFLATLLVVIILLPSQNCLASQDTAFFTQQVTITPANIDEQIIYPTTHTNIETNTWTITNWENITLPPSWDQAGYYFEIWDHQNKKVPGFSARPLITDKIDLSNIDASLYTKIRLVVFVPDYISSRPTAGPVVFQHSKIFNTKLLVLAILITTILLILTAAAVRYRLGPKTIQQTVSNLLRQTNQQYKTSALFSYSLIILLGASLFGLALGLFNQGWHTFYLTIKFPFIFLCAFLLSVSATITISLLIGVKKSVRAMVGQSLASLAVTAIALVSFVPLVVFFIILPQNHDELLLSTLIMIGLAYLLGIYHYYQWLKFNQIKYRLAVIAIWTSLYGLTLIQLGWILRPWVGVLDPINQTVAFSRLYGGSVFVELGNVLERLL